MDDLLDRLKEALADRYVLQRELGRGGMATVYLADDLRHHRPVAIKVLRPELATALGPDRFLREIEVTAQLHHPMILPLLDSGEADGTLFYVMPFVEGESLRDRLERDRQLSLEDALQITKDVAEALGYAHSRGVIHRDIKPENILLESGHALVADFGIAKAVTEAGGEKLTGTGVSIGTPAYMSPEQAEATAPVDARSDLYSLGCVLYEMLAGHPPFVGTTAHELIVRHASDPIPPLRSGRSTVPEPIEEAVEKVLSKVPADRYATAQQFSQALAVDVGSHRRAQRRKRWLKRVGSVAAGLIVLVGGTYGTVRYRAMNNWMRVPLDSNTVVVLPFDVTGESTNYEKGIPELLFTALTGEVGPRAVDMGSLLRRQSDWQARGRWGEEDAPVRLAASFGAGLLLEGRVVEVGRRLVVNALLRLVPNGREVARASLDIDPDSLNVLPLRLMVQLLGEQLGEDAKRLADQDPEAVREYMGGMIAYRRGSYSEAAERFSRALARDSTFVLAAVALARAREADVAPVDPRVMAIIQASRDSLSPQDRAWLDAQGVSLDARKLVGAHERWAAAAPEDAAAQRMYGFALRTTGAPLELRDWRARADAAWQRAWEQDSVTPRSVMGLARMAAMVGDLSWLRRIGPQFVAVADSATDWWAVYRWAIAVAEGDSSTVRDLGARAAARNPRVANPRSAWAATLLFLHGILSVDDVDLISRQASAMATPENALQMVLPMEIASLARGRMDTVVRFYHDPECAKQFDWCRPPYRWVYLLDYWLEYPGLDSVAGAAADSLSAWVSTGRAFTPESGVTRLDGRCFPLMYRAVRGDTLGIRGAVASIRREYGEGDPVAVCPLVVDALLERYDRDKLDTPALDTLEAVSRWRMWVVPHLPLVARLRRERGQYEKALAAARARFLGAGEDCEAFTPYLREEGRAAEALGDTVAAIRAYREYLRLRTDPDPGGVQAEVDSVRAALARMQARRR